MGAGRTELAMSLLVRAIIDISGRIKINGREVNLPNVRAAIKEGLGMS